MQAARAVSERSPGVLQQAAQGLQRAPVHAKWTGLAGSPASVVMQSQHWSRAGPTQSGICQTPKGAPEPAHHVAVCGCHDSKHGLHTARSHKYHSGHLASVHIGAPSSTEAWQLGRVTASKTPFPPPCHLTWDADLRAWSSIGKRAAWAGAPSSTGAAEREGPCAGGCTAQGVRHVSDMSHGTQAQAQDTTAGARHDTSCSASAGATGWVSGSGRGIIA